MTTLSGSLSPLSITPPVEPTHGVRSTKTTSRNNKERGKRMRGYSRGKEQNQEGDVPSNSCCVCGRIK